MTEQNKQSSQPFAWYWYDQHGCLYITGHDRKPDLPSDAQPLYATEQNKQSDTPAPQTQMSGFIDALRGALEPFARASSDFDSYQVGYIVDHGKSLTVGDLRLAKAAFDTPAPQDHVVPTREQMLESALTAAVETIKDYLACKHDGDPWTEDSRAMGEMDINDYGRDGRLDYALKLLAATEGSDNG